MEKYISKVWGKCKNLIGKTMVCCFHELEKKK